MSVALLIARLVLGLGMAAHGSQKLFGWFGGHGLTGTGGLFENLGFRPGRAFAFLAGAGEFGSGVLISLGLLGPIGPALLILVMTVAALAVHVRNGFFVTKNGVEVPAIYATGAFILAFTGPGALSLDALLGLERYWTPGLATAAVVAAVVSGLANVAARRAPAQAPSR